ncbi:MAG: DUF6940 family protein [Chitinophagales bacterium]
MYKITTTEIQKGKVTKFQIEEAGRKLNFNDFMQLLQSSFAFRAFFINLLKNSNYEAYFFEVKAINFQKRTHDFEFVLVHSTILPRIKANKSFFQPYFDDEKTVVSFPNLGKDAELIVPTALSNDKNYAHLATFVRNAPMNQVHDFWQKVGQKYEKATADSATKWLSTAGLGVYWLHVRIDTRPKYYRYQAYKTIG